MNKTAKVLFGIGAALLFAVPTLETIKVVQSERKKREEIETNRVKTITAMQVASARIVKRIQAGDYNGKSINDIMNDFDFESMMLFNE